MAAQQTLRIVSYFLGLEFHDENPEQVSVSSNQSQHSSAVIADSAMAIASHPVGLIAILMDVIFLNSKIYSTYGRQRLKSVGDGYINEIFLAIHISKALAQVSNLDALSILKKDLQKRYNSLSTFIYLPVHSLFF